MEQLIDQKKQSVPNQHGMVLKRTNPQNTKHHKRSNNPPNLHFNDPAIMQISNGNDHRFGSTNNQQNRSQKPHKYQTSHTPHKNNQFYAQYYPKKNEEKMKEFEHSNKYKLGSSLLNNVTSDYMASKHRDRFPVYIGTEQKKINYSNHEHDEL